MWGIGLRGANTTASSSGTPDMTSRWVVTVEHPLGTHQMTSRSLETLQTKSITMETASGSSGTFKTTTGSLGIRNAPDDFTIIRNTPADNLRIGWNARDEIRSVRKAYIGFCSCDGSIVFLSAL